MVKILNCNLYAKKSYGTLSKGAIFFANSVRYYCTSGSQTFLKFQLCSPQRFFSTTHGPLFLSINFHAKSNEEQKRSLPPQMSNQAQFNG